MHELSGPSFIAAAALAGWNVVVTRPRDSAEPLIRGLRRNGAIVLRLPAQNVEANPAFDWPATLATRDRIDDWLFTSPSAVRHAQALLTTGSPDGCVFAVGSSTARALARHGINAIAPKQRHTSEALLDLPELVDIAGHRVAIITAAGGRAAIANTLRERGADVVEWFVYRRTPVIWSRRQLAALANADDPLLTIVSSAQALSFIATTLPPALWQRLRDARWIASSARIEAALRERGATRIDIAASALTADLLKSAPSLRG